MGFSTCFQDTIITVVQMGFLEINEIQSIYIYSRMGLAVSRNHSLWFHCVSIPLCNHFNHSIKQLQRWIIAYLVVEVSRSSGVTDGNNHGCDMYVAVGKTSWFNQKQEMVNRKPVTSTIKLCLRLCYANMTIVLLLRKIKTISRLLILSSLKCEWNKVL